MRTQLAHLLLPFPRLLQKQAMRTSFRKKVGDSADNSLIDRIVDITFDAVATIDPVPAPLSSYVSHRFLGPEGAALQSAYWALECYYEQDLGIAINRSHSDYSQKPTVLDVMLWAYAAYQEQHTQ